MATFWGGYSKCIRSKMFKIFEFFDDITAHSPKEFIDIKLVIIDISCFFVFG